MQYLLLTVQMLNDLKPSVLSVCITAEWIFHNETISAALSLKTTISNFQNSSQSISENKTAANDGNSIYGLNRWMQVLGFSSVKQRMTRLWKPRAWKPQTFLIEQSVLWRLLSDRSRASQYTVENPLWPRPSASASAFTNPRLHFKDEASELGCVALPGCITWHF